MNLRKHWPFLALLAALTVFIIWGIPLIPFHPDESTYIFMSADFETFIHDPFSLAWKASREYVAGQDNREESVRQLYRELDAPLTRDLIGLARSITGQPALPVDWDWSASWEANQKAGALPGPDLLLVSRLGIVMLLPFSLIFLYLSGIRLGGPLTGWLAVLLMGLNALALLHNRRAMAEGGLTFAVCLAIFAMLDAEKRPWLAGLAVGLAFCTKQSTIALFPAGALAVIAIEGSDIRRRIWQTRAINLTQFGIAALLIILILNPIYWSNPWLAAKAAIQQRQGLMQRQIEAARAFNHDQLLDTNLERGISLIANLFLLPPATAELANYQPHTSASEKSYLQIAGHNWLRGLAGGGIALIFTLFGFILAVIKFFQSRAEQRRTIGLLLCAFLVQLVLLFFAIPLSWQRYMMPLVPFTCLWMSFGVSRLLSSIQPFRFTHQDSG